MKKERAVVLIAFAFVLAFAAFFAVIQIVRAFNGPPSGCTPPNCQGAVGVNSSNNLSVGTTTPIANTKFLIVASDTSASNYSLKILQPATTPIFVVENNGYLGIATGSPAYQLDVVGTIRATTLLGNWSGTLTSNNVTNGVFGSCGTCGGGIYSFPSSLGVATSTNGTLPQSLSVYGGGYFSGSVGIGTTNPGAPLDIAGNMQVKSNGTIEVPGSKNTYNGMIETNYAAGDQYGLGQFTGGVLALYTSDAYSPSSIQFGRLTSAPAFTSLMTITHGGNVGIGTTAPSTMLTVAGGNTAGGEDIMQDNGSQSTELAQNGWGNSFGILFNAYQPTVATSGELWVTGNTLYKYSGGPYNTAAAAIGGDLNNGGSGGMIGFYSAPNGTSSQPITWTQTGGLSKSSVWFSPRGTGSDFWISGNGNVGIGTSTPDNKLQVAGYLDFQDVSFGTFFGNGAGGKNNQASGTENSFFGYNAGFNNTTGYQNVAMGSAAMGYNTTGYVNVGIGEEALLYNTTGINNTGVGAYALIANATGNDNTALGYNALGGTAGYSTTTADTAVGSGAMSNTTTGGWDTALGDNALYYNTTGYQNTATGWRALYYNTTGYNNTANGLQALYDNTTGYYNVAVGYNALTYNNAGYQNTAVGMFALDLSSSTTNNTGVGYDAGFNNSSGNQNTFIGSGAGYSDTSGSGNVFLGYQAGYSETGSNKLYIANTSGIPLIYGNFSSGFVGIGTTGPSYPLDVVGNIRTSGCLYYNGGSVGTCASDVRLKTDISPITGVLDRVTELQPVSFEWKDPSSYSSGTQWGLIAQDVDKVFPELVATSTDGYYTVNYGQKIEMLLLEALKELDAAALKVKNGVAQVGELIADKVTAKTVVTNSLEMKDSATGAIYCVRITNGEFAKTPGQCGD